MQTETHSTLTAQHNPLEFAMESIKQGIRRGEYAPGQRLIEADLIQQLGVKRGYIREALRILSGDGIVELVPQKGARVKKLSVTDFVDMLPVLAALLSVSVDLAMDKLQEPAQKEKLERIISQMRYWAERRDSTQFHIAAMPYHQAINDATGNNFIKYINSKIHSDIFQQQFSNAVSSVEWDEYITHFESLHKALMSGDRNTARQLIYEQQQRMIEVFKSAHQSHHGN